MELELIGAALFAAGMAAGRWWPARRKGPKPLKPVKPLCGCGHHRSYHTDGGKCHDRVYLGSRYDDCNCQKYTGPEPLPEYYAPEITP